MKTYQLKPKNNSDIIYIGISLLIMNFFILYAYSEVSLSNLLTTSVGIIQVIYIPVALYFTVRSGIIAYWSDKSVILWVLISVFLSPLSMIVLGKKKTIQIDSDKMQIYYKYSNKYSLELNKLDKKYSKKLISNMEYEKKKKEYLEIFEIEMNKDIKEFETFKIDRLNQNVTHEKNIDNRSLKKNIYSTCPACNHKLSENNNECPECGLFLG
ncbi:MAG: hypothetical protein ABFS12_18190 [Bacteroidota bacterium]